MKQFKGTKGQWDFVAGIHVRTLLETKEDVICIPHPKSNKDWVENAKLIADAGTTVNKCGLFPSTLLCQRDDLLKALHDLLVHAVENDLHSEFTNNAEIAIKKALKQNGKY